MNTPGCGKTTGNDPVIFKKDSDTSFINTSSEFYKVMIVDDEASVHDITVTSLKEIQYEGRGIRFLHAYSGQEAADLFDQNPDTALALVDVVMETQDAGLKLVHYIRHELKNQLVQIAIRTGQPGMAPEYDIITRYGINAYYSKTELKIQKLVSLIVTSLRMFELSTRLEHELSRRKKAEAELLALNRRLEEEVRERTEEAVRANQLKSQFLANMSHEIRTPMNGIIGMSDILMAEPLSEKQKDYVSVIKSSSASLLVIINDILDLSKIESGQLTFEDRSFSLKMLVEEVVSIFRFKAGEKRIRLISEITEITAPVLIGDETRIKQILINLVGNAVKFTEKGFVRIRVSVNPNVAGQYILTAEVEDTGPGVDDAYKPLLFKKFSQKDASIARKFGGTGLGLAISRQLANLMGGDIVVENREVGNGSIFKVSVSVKKSDKKIEDIRDDTLREASSAAHDIAGMNLRILLAEDNPVNQKVMKVLLEKYHVGVDLAHDGEQVLEKIENRRYDLILMDVQMPKLDGLSTTRIIRDLDSENVHKNVPIIALTALAMAEDEGKCLSAGMDAYVSKPIAPKKLLGAMLRVLKKKS